MWNTVYIERAVTHLRNLHRQIPDHLLKHATPHDVHAPFDLSVSLGTILVPTPNLLRRSKRQARGMNMAGPRPPDGASLCTDHSAARRDQMSENSPSVSVSTKPP